MFRRGPSGPVTLSGTIVSRGKAALSRCDLRGLNMAADVLLWMLPNAGPAARPKTLIWLSLNGNPITVLLINVRRSQTRRLAMST
jgi:hypothetical protein